MESFKQYTKDTADRLSHSAGRILAAPLRLKSIREPVKQTIKGGLLLTRWMGKSLEQPQKELINIFKEAQKESNASAADQEKKIPIREEFANQESLHDKSHEELYEMAQEYDISGRSEMNKEELIKAIREK